MTGLIHFHHEIFKHSPVTKYFYGLSLFHPYCKDHIINLGRTLLSILSCRLFTINIHNAIYLGSTFQVSIHTNEHIQSCNSRWYLDLRKTLSVYNSDQKWGDWKSAVIVTIQRMNTGEKGHELWWYKGDTWYRVVRLHMKNRQHCWHHNATF